ncbi:MAG: hypothetical protein EXS43_06515 [Opitutus sp.]|nr:hypothetical protein [Opitutus sp.]
MLPHAFSSRRGFLKVTGGALGLAALGRSPAIFAADGQQPPALDGKSTVRLGRTVPRRFTIDCHMHYQKRPYFFEGLLTHFRERNAMACVNGWRPEYPAIIEAARKSPDTVIPFGRISVDSADVLADLDYFAANGCRGIKLRDPRYNWDDERYFPIYERIEKMGVPALYHTGIAGFGTMGFPRMRAEYLMTIAAKFTKLQIIGAHFGNPAYAEAAEVARWCKNVHFDITGSTLTKLQGNLKAMKDYLWWEGPTAHSAPDTVYAFEKIVFGTDEAPERLDNMMGRHEDMFDACAVPEDCRRKVFGGTMARILGIPVRA